MAITVIFFLRAAACLRRPPVQFHEARFASDVDDRRGHNKLASGSIRVVGGWSGGLGGCRRARPSVFYVRLCALRNEYGYDEHRHTVKSIAQTSERWRGAGGWRSGELERDVM